MMTPTPCTFESLDKLGKALETAEEQRKKNETEAALALAKKTQLQSLFERLTAAIPDYNLAFSEKKQLLIDLPKRKEDLKASLDCHIAEECRKELVAGLAKYNDALKKARDAVEAAEACPGADTIHGAKAEVDKAEAAVKKATGALEDALNAGAKLRSAVDAQDQTITRLEKVACDAAGDRSSAYVEFLLLDTIETHGGLDADDCARGEALAAAVTKLLADLEAEEAKLKTSKETLAAKEMELEKAKSYVAELEADRGIPWIVKAAPACADKNAKKAGA